MTTTPITGDTWGDELDRPRAYILTEAERPFVELTPIFEKAHAALVAQLGGVSEAQASFKPGSAGGEEDYSIAEVSRHMIEVIPLIGSRIRALATSGEPPAMQGPGSLGGNEGLALPQLIDLLNGARDSMLRSVAEVDGKERLDATIRHRLFGDLNCRGWLVMQALHVDDHARQIAKIKAHPGYPKS